MTDRHLRQGFLGKDAERILQEAVVGVVGLGGGGSHIVQQLAHIGVGTIIAVDPDHVEMTNLNRLVGATSTDAKTATAKTEIARRVAEAVNPTVQLVPMHVPWQDCDLVLRGCTCIFGCVDSWSEREQLERFARRFLIPYIDIGMDVHELQDKSFSISGQVFVSMPDCPCLRCADILTDELLAEEAATYGAAGGKPQVIWPNGVLASAAIGLFMQLLTPWHARSQPFSFLEYDGDNQILHPSPLSELIRAQPCKHFFPTEIGDPMFEDPSASSK